MLLAAALSTVVMASCQKSLEEKAAAEAEEFTRRECPVNIAENIIQDSMTYDNATRTIAYHYTLQGALDNKELLRQHANEYDMHFRQGINTMPELRQYVDAGFEFRYVYRSQKTRDILLDFKYRSKDTNK